MLCWLVNVSDVYMEYGETCLFFWWLVVLSVNSLLFPSHTISLDM